MMGGKSRVENKLFYLKKVFLWGFYSKQGEGSMYYTWKQNITESNGNYGSCMKTFWCSLWSTFIFEAFNDSVENRICFHLSTKSMTIFEFHIVKYLVSLSLKHYICSYAGRDHFQLVLNQMLKPLSHWWLVNPSRFSDHWWLHHIQWSMLQFWSTQSDTWWCKWHQLQPLKTLQIQHISKNGGIYHKLIFFPFSLSVVSELLTVQLLLLIQ